MPLGLSGIEETWNGSSDGSLSNVVGNGGCSPFSRSVMIARNDLMPNTTFSGSRSDIRGSLPAVYSSELIKAGNRMFSKQNFWYL